ncbi:hypothetical protein HHI36_018745 [Cryptolaemus montrouzieri]|uniref:Uncharacterized protein n=1 Tax=Cryptolaemus montrouzieri TaxID=559131 RepID=A0ABD2P1I3_9CUCU
MPHKWIFKNFVLSGILDLATTSTSIQVLVHPKNHDVDLPNISVSSSVVVRLSKTIPGIQNFRLDFDYWYMSLDLFGGTIKANRVLGYEGAQEKGKRDSS